MDNQYAERDIMHLDVKGGHYSRHLNAMTGEGLHDKSDIAAELAYRDARIAELEKQIAAHEAAEEMHILQRLRVEQERDAAVEREQALAAHVDESHDLWDKINSSTPGAQEHFAMFYKLHGKLSQRASHLKGS